jgi:hypothetical protein
MFKIHLFLSTVCNFFQIGQFLVVQQVEMK